MKKYLFLGDTHGDLDFAENAMWIAKEEGCEEIIQCGDWGFKWPKSDCVDYVSTLLHRHGITMRWIDGNHDDHDWLGTVVPKQGGIIAPDQWPEPVVIAPFLIYQPRGSTYTDEEGTRFLFCGGAPSIDKGHRIPGRSWWPQETITEDQFRYAMAAQTPVDVLVTHDAAAFPDGYGPKGDPEFQALGARSMEMIASLVEQHRPLLHVHGHWHKRYERTDGVTRTIGLASNLQTTNAATEVWSKP